MTKNDKSAENYANSYATMIADQAKFVEEKVLDARKYF
jgi:hypothetical protein